MKRILPILSILLFAVHLRAADIDATLVNGGEKVYQSLLKQLAAGKENSDETKLQKALLYKLINLSRVKPPQSITIKPPSDEAHYRKAAMAYGNRLLSKASILANLQSLHEKIDGVRNQLLHGSDDNATTPLTLQLQYAFYLKGKRLYEHKLHLYQEAIAKAPKLFSDALKRISFDVNATGQNLQKIEKELRKKREEIQRMEVERERLNLLGRTAAVTRITHELQRLHGEEKRILNKKLLELFIRYSIALKEKRSKKAFDLQRRMMSLVEKTYPASVHTDMAKLFHKMDLLTLGRAETLKGATREEVEAVVKDFWHRANAPLFDINKTPISAFKLFLALLVFVLGFIFGQLYKSGIKRLTKNSTSITPSTQTLLANLGYYIIVIIAFFIMLKVLGINLTSIALVAGALSVGIGFGLQNMVSNFVSGLILMFERSIKIGDYVELDNDLRGHVSDIRMRSTTITTNDNIDVIVPNQDLIQNRVVNWTMNDRIRRFKIPFGVAYGTDVQKVETVILEAVATSGFTDIYEKGHRKTRVIMTGMGDSSVDFELFVWIQGREILFPRRTTSRFLKLIYKALNIHGIEIPFPQRDIHIRSVDGEIPLKVDNAKHGDKSGTNIGN
ncbi:mechanosensitive ion channel domain-containing protein [Hydrogenimonas sp. SS33]|uniref:mechanosensitive ion channel family protein n=1 Tax=Hydrogenimonas leucolamina TaxID=2954236 RepID=UPI00336BB5B6